jgi:hypothetical protein
VFLLPCARVPLGFPAFQAVAFLAAACPEAFGLVAAFGLLAADLGGKPAARFKAGLP